MTDWIVWFIFVGLPIGSAVVAALGTAWADHYERKHMEQL